ncbi:MAG: 5'-nucleotidase C-terminal domain-containing protein [Firmicutes bacterium]|nr:5'-nucleotidase C-terminal domain-containing protein [Dethiobacter sp.]MBS3888090.1 5'-nucleotidase C-terminal domain-containing protein [Bacillota bacterium]MBS4053937.1 5'-nucleotidase C-terminal domain-containing protein [Thermaerobacter sp.]
MKISLVSRRFIALMVMIALILPQLGVAAMASAPTTITIFHTNDIHSRVTASDTQIGYARMATIVQAARAANPHVLLLEAGDAFHGQSIANLSQGQAIVDIMNVMQYDAMVPGNHDFNFGKARLMELASRATFPLVAANVEPTTLPSHIIRELGGKRVAIIGVATPETAFKTHPRNVEGLKFADPVASVSRLVATLRPQVDFIVALSHLGQEGDYTSIKLAQEVQGLDLIIDGHSHDTLTLQVGRTIIVQAGEFGNALGRVDITFDPAGRRIAHTLIYANQTTAVASDPRVQTIINTYNQQVSAVHSQVVGKTAVRLEGERAFVRTAETNLGNLITDAMLKVTGADVAVTNGGGIRASIVSGNVTRGQVFNVLPFGNLIVALPMTGAQILEMLEFSARLLPAQNGGFLQVAGLTFSIDTAREAGRRVHSARINGVALAPAKTYLVATNDFLAAGGDGYAMLGSIPIRAQMMSLEEAFAEHVARLGEITSAVVGQRITLAPTPAVVQVPTPEQPKTEQPSTPPEQTVTPPTLPVAPPTAHVPHVVKSGEVLWRIALKHGTTWQELAHHNNLANPNRLRVGQTIFIPSVGAPQTGPIVHIVARGDTLWAIARKHNVNWHRLHHHNNLVNPALIRPGQRIVIPPAA